MPIYAEHVCALRKFSHGFPGVIGLNLPAMFIRAILSGASSGLDHWMIALLYFLVHNIDTDHHGLVVLSTSKRCPQ